MGKLNIAEFLKDCPKDMELDCLIYEDVYFDYVDELNIIHCYIQHETHKTSLTFNQYGTPNSDIKSKCVIFPKSKKTWEGFQRPFEDGDIISDSLGTCIFKGEGMIQGTVDYYCGVHGDYFIVKLQPEWHYGDIVDYRLATEEEMQKLFDAIKANGYKWNHETKTLEKLIEPKFNVGDVVRLKSKPSYIYTIYCLAWDDNKKLAYKLLPKNDKHLILVSLNTQDDYELVPNKFDISNLKPFDKVLVRLTKYNVWNATFFSHYDKEVNYGCYPFVTTSSKSYSMCIPYEGNEHLLGTTNDCEEFYKTW